LIDFGEKNFVMSGCSAHKVHIPVLGLGYSIDTPAKVARFGISSVVSIIDDELIEIMRAFHCRQAGVPYVEISKNDVDHRAKRVTAYLDLLQDIVTSQVATLRELPFCTDSEIDRYFDMLPDGAQAKELYCRMRASADDAARAKLQAELRQYITPGAIDVNIMAKVDNKHEGLPPEYSDALTAFRGFADSKLESAVVLSAGYNPRLYSYIEQFDDFYPDQNGRLKKRIILKVSDYRSAAVQGKILAKKGLWVSEFRVESGLNCGGHAFATEGLLLGPILSEFAGKRQELAAELLALCNAANLAKNRATFGRMPVMKLTAQGGIGTALENEFLLQHYGLDGTGWGSPFLLVPEATNVDPETLGQLVTAKPTDYFLSAASPLGVPFNNFRNSTAEKQRAARIDKGRPGSPCYKKFLASNTELTEERLCTASRAYQRLKIAQLDSLRLPAEEYEAELKDITAKDCLCTGLAAPVYLKNNIQAPHRMHAVTICPGPNLAYFSGVFSLARMMGHIYGRLNILNKVPRPHMFINELKIYAGYFAGQVKDAGMKPRQVQYLLGFRANLLQGIDYYLALLPDISNEPAESIDAMRQALFETRAYVQSLKVPEVIAVL